MLPAQMLSFETRTRPERARRTGVVCGKRGQTRRQVRGGQAALLAAVVVALAAPGSAFAASDLWEQRIADARAFAEARQGVVYFGITGLEGGLHGWHTGRTAPSASVLKAMLLVAYLREDSVRDRPLNEYDRSLLRPMIRRSANEPATRIIGIVGSRAIYRVSSRAGMRKFVFRMPIWGSSSITVRDQARFFRDIDEHLPKRHRAYGLRLLRTITPSQRWGIPPVTPEGWTIHFKGGWGSGTGRVTHQVALLEDGDRRLSIAVLTQWNPNQAYGERTIRGVARRLLRGF